MVLATFKLDPNIWREFQQKAKANGTNASELLRQWVSAYIQDTTATQQDRLTRLESRLSQIETRLDTARPTQPVVQLERFSMPLRPAASELTTQQAYRLAVSRGCTKSKEGFRSWSKRNPDLCEQMYGLRVLENSSRDNTAASYQDLL